MFEGPHARRWHLILPIFEGLDLSVVFVGHGAGLGCGVGEARLVLLERRVDLYHLELLGLQRVDLVALMVEGRDRTLCRG